MTLIVSKIAKYKDHKIDFSHMKILDPNKPINCPLNNGPLV